MTRRKRLKMGPLVAPINARRGNENADLVVLWCLRIFFSPRRDFDSLDGGVADRLIRLARIPVPEDITARAELSPALFESRLRDLERKPPRPDGVLARNLHEAGKVLALSDEERLLLAFAALIHSETVLDDIADMFSRLSNREAMPILEEVLQLPSGTVEQALGRDGNLVTSGLLDLDPDSHQLRGKLRLLAGFDDALLTSHERPEDLFSNYLRPSVPPRLSIADYPHVKQDRRLLERYLADASERRCRGVNALIHGPSGTGKTQLARVLAARLGLRLYEIPTEGISLSLFEQADRLRAYRLAQRMLAYDARSAILFDEIEDLFPATLHGMFKQQNPGKALVNDLLEYNAVPALWLSNSVWQMDPAAVRRFDLVLELGTPNRAVRRRILEKHLTGLPVRPAWIERMAENEHLAPAVVERATKVAAVLKGASPKALEQTLERVLGNTLEAMGLPRAAPAAVQPVTTYRLDCLNPDADLRELATGLRRDPRGRLCLYGPPGTGKTAFGQFLARELDRPLLVRRASDLLGPYVGMTERQIAQMFEQAERDSAVLLLDEADSFLRDRSGAHQAWEVTQVNELLTRMEAFEGLFVCSTNLLDDLDPASLRRFDLKIRFDYLLPEQTWRLFREVLKACGGDKPAKAHWLPQLTRLDRLTPGDFATLVRRQRLAPEPLTASALYNGLCREQGFKTPSPGGAIGFTARL